MHVYKTPRSPVSSLEVESNILSDSYHSSYSFVYLIICDICNSRLFVRLHPVFIT